MGLDMTHQITGTVKQGMSMIANSVSLHVENVKT